MGLFYLFLRIFSSELLKIADDAAESFKQKKNPAAKKQRGIKIR